MAFPVVALGGAPSLVAGPIRAPTGSRRVASRVQAVVPSARPRSLRRLATSRALPLGSQPQQDEPTETDAQREARLTADAVYLVEFRLGKVLPKGMLDSVTIPAKLTEIRSFVRWEDAGKPENTSREWQVREYQAALVDLKLEMLAGGNLNDVRRRYNLDTEFGQDAPLFAPNSEQLSLLRIAANLVKEPEYYAPGKIAAIVANEVNKDLDLKAESRARIDRVAGGTGTPAGDSKITNATDTVAALELAFETQISDVGKADAIAAVEEEEDLHARIAAAAEMMVRVRHEAAQRNAEAETAASAAASADEHSHGDFGDDELAVLKKRLQQEADIAMDKARVKVDAAKKVKAQMEQLAMKTKAAQAAAKVVVAPVAPVAAAKELTPELTPAQMRQREFTKAKAVAEAQLAAAREEMAAAKAALEATTTRSAVVTPVFPAAVAFAPFAANAVPTPAFPPPPVVSAPASATPVVAVAATPVPAAAPAPVTVTAPAPTVYGVKRSATEIELKASAKRAAVAAAADVASTAALKRRREEAAREKRSAEAAVVAAKETKRAASATAAAVASAVDDRVKSLENLHSRHIESLVVEHTQALVAARALGAADLVASLDESSSSSESLLRGKLSEAVAALETSNAQVKELKRKLARGAEELAKVKVITQKAAEVLESRSTDQRLISSLKLELDVAVELEAAAEARAAAAEKTSAALKKSVGVPLGEKSKDETIAQLTLDLTNANEAVVEFKTAWEADRKVIALLSETGGASETNNQQLAATVKAAKTDANLKSAGLWGLAKKYGKKTLEVSSELWFGEGKDANAADVALRASAAKRNNALVVSAAAANAAANAADDDDVYSRVGGSATVARFRAKQAATGGGAENTKRALRQRSWLAAAATATDEATRDAGAAPPVVAKAAGPVFTDVVIETKVVAETKVVDTKVVPATPKAPSVPVKTPFPVSETQRNNAVPVPTAVKKAVATTQERVAVAAASPKPAPKAWGASTSQSAAASPSTAFAPSIKIPLASAGNDDDKPTSSGWSSAHMPPGR